MGESRARRPGPWGLRDGGGFALQVSRNDLFDIQAIEKITRYCIKYCMPFAEGKIGLVMCQGLLRSEAVRIQALEGDKPSIFTVQLTTATKESCF